MRTRSSVLGPLESALADPSVREVFVAPDGRVTLRTDRGPEPMDPPPFDAAGARRFALRLSAALGAALGKDVEQAKGILDGDLRVFVAGPPLVTDGAAVRLVRMPVSPPGLEALERAERIEPPLSGLLRRAVAARLSMLIVGPRGTGRGALLGAVATDWLRAGVRVAMVESRQLSEGGLDWLAVGRVRGAVELGADAIAHEDPDSEAWSELLISGRPFVSTIEAATAGAGLRRVLAHLLHARPGVAFGGAEALVASSVDLVVEMAAEGVRSVAEPEIWARELSLRPLVDPKDPRRLALAGSHALRRLGRHADGLDVATDAARPSRSRRESSVVGGLLGAALAVRRPSELVEVPDALLDAPRPAELKRDPAPAEDSLARARAQLAGLSVEVPAAETVAELGPVPPPVRSMREVRDRDEWPDPDLDEAALEAADGLEPDPDDDPLDRTTGAEVAGGDGFAHTAADAFLSEPDPDGPDAVDTALSADAPDTDQALLDDLSDDGLSDRALDAELDEGLEDELADELDAELGTEAGYADDDGLDALPAVEDPDAAAIEAALAADAAREEWGFDEDTSFEADLFDAEVLHSLEHHTARASSGDDTFLAMEAPDGLREAVAAAVAAAGSDAAEEDLPATGHDFTPDEAAFDGRFDDEEGTLDGSDVLDAPPPPPVASIHEPVAPPIPRPRGVSITTDVFERRLLDDDTKRATEIGTAEELGILRRASRRLAGGGLLGAPDASAEATRPPDLDELETGSPGLGLDDEEDAELDALGADDDADADPPSLHDLAPDAAHSLVAARLPRQFSELDHKIAAAETMGFTLDGELPPPFSPSSLPPPPPPVERRGSPPGRVVSPASRPPIALGPPGGFPSDDVETGLELDPPDDPEVPAGGFDEVTPFSSLLRSEVDAEAAVEPSELDDQPENDRTLILPPGATNAGMVLPTPAEQAAMRARALAEAERDYDPDLTIDAPLDDGPSSVRPSAADVFSRRRGGSGGS